MYVELGPIVTKRLPDDVLVNINHDMIYLVSLSPTRSTSHLSTPAILMAHYKTAVSTIMQF